MSNFDAPPGMTVDLTQSMTVGKVYQITHQLLGVLRVRLSRKHPGSIEVIIDGEHVTLSQGYITAVTGEAS